MSRAGFTLVEVMIAMAVILVGASGILALQTSTRKGNSEAREQTTALTFGATWVERVKRDAMLWIDRDDGPANTQYLTWLPAQVPTWVVPDPADATESASADFWGYDTTLIPEKRYCVNLRTTPLTHSIPADPTSMPVTMRVDVRVWWLRGGRMIPGQSEMMNCGTAGAPGTVPADAVLAHPDVRVIGMSTIVGIMEPEQ